MMALPSLIQDETLCTKRRAQQDSIAKKHGFARILDWSLLRYLMVFVWVMEVELLCASGFHDSVEDGELAGSQTTDHNATCA